VWPLHECASGCIRTCRLENSIVDIEKTFKCNVFVGFLFGWVSHEGKPSAIDNMTFSSQRSFDRVDVFSGDDPWPWEDRIAIEIKRDHGD
jgi:hypothetical protein